MGEIPSRLLAGLSPAATDAARDWWDRLAQPYRTDVIALYAPLGRPPGTLKVIGGRFVPDDDAAGWSEWLAAYFEHLVAQPDLVLYEPPFIRAFHIG